MGPEITLNKFINQFVLIGHGHLAEIRLYSPAAKQKAQSLLLEAKPQPLENLVEAIIAHVGQELILNSEDSELAEDVAELKIIGTDSIYMIKLVTEHGLEAIG